MLLMINLRLSQNNYKPVKIKIMNVAIIIGNCSTATATRNLTSNKFVIDQISEMNDE